MQSPPPQVYQNSTAQCAGDNAYAINARRAPLLLFQEEQEEDQPKHRWRPSFDKLYPELPKVLNGTHWCNSSAAPPGFLKDRVALVMVGQAFRSRNFFTDARASCTDGTTKAQEKLSMNHMQMVVEPIELELGMQVDVFLTETPCGEERTPEGGDRRLSELEAATPFDQIGLLKQWYDPKRVKGVVTMNVTENMEHRDAGTLRMLDDYMRAANGTYEYFIVLRYDIFFDSPFLKMRWPTAGEPAHHGLSFFGAVHDWVFSFPGEMWGCMLKLWTECLVRTEWINSDLSPSVRRRAGCFDFGPVELQVWSSGWGHASLLDAVQRVLRTRRPKLVPDWKRRMHKNGTSAFDVNGHEHRCTGSWYWPPRNSFEDRPMPSYFHVA